MDFFFLIFRVLILLWTVVGFVVDFVFGLGVVAGKEFDVEKEVNSNNEWKEKVEKWKTRQEKKGYGNDDYNGGNDDEEEDDFL